MKGGGGREESLTARTLAGLKWSYLSAALQAMLSLLILAVLSRLLAPSDFGLLAIALIFVLAMETAGKVGVGPAIVQRLELTDRHVETGATLSLALGAVMAATLWLAAPLAGRFFAEPLLPSMLRALSPVFVVTGAGVVSEHLLRRQLRFDRLAAAHILSQSVGYGLVTIVMALKGFGVWALVAGTLMRHVLFTAIVVAFRPPPARLRLARREALDLLGFGAGHSLVSVFNTIAQQGGLLVVGRWLGAAPLGHYTRAHRIATLPLDAGLVLLNVLFPAMSERQRDTGRLGTVYLHGVEALSLVALPASVAMVVLAPEIVAVVLGGQWDDAVPVLQVLAAGVVFQVYDSLNVPCIRALGAVWREAGRQAVYALLVVAGAWLGSRWGVGGVAVAVVCAWVVAHVLMTRISLSLLGLSWRRLLRRHLPALWVGAWSGFALCLAAWQVRTLPIPAGARLGLELAAWGAAALAAMYLAPSPARPASLHWVLPHLRLDAMGAPGRRLRSLLTRLGPRAPG